MTAAYVARRDEDDAPVWEDNAPVGWLQRDDGSWWTVDEYGIAYPVAAFRPDPDLDAEAQAALGPLGDPIDITPSSVVDVEVPR
ncbi:hypothetical protein ACWESM_18425 [Nocardia sp. NPDC003999]